MGISGISLWSRYLKMAFNTFFDTGLPDVVPKEREKNEHEKKLATIPYDPRFPNQNQTRNCWQNYVDFHRCQSLKGEEYQPCQFFYKNFMAICPLHWVEKWDEQRENGSFPAKLS